MRRFQCALLAAVAVIGFASVASAADLPVKAPPPPPPSPVYNWSGFYIGGNVGGAWGLQDQTTNTNGSSWGVTPLPPLFSSYGSPAFRPSSFTGGLQAGWNSQINNIVLGVEGDIRWMSLKSSQDFYFNDGSLNPQPNSRIAQSAETTWLATLRPRLGWAANNWLLYATGGAAFGGVKSSFNYYNVVWGSLPYNSGSSSTTKAGWVVGGGVEWAFAAHWTAGLQYLHADLGSVSYTTTPGANPDATRLENISMQTKIDLMTLSLNYKF
jgi:outer membrane immunogenic protein